MLSQSNSNMRVSTPELLWHGGGAENGKPDPVFSLDLFDCDILATAGVDENIPPKGSVRLWKIGDTDADLKFLVDLSDHQSTVNVVRFSPCGKMIATASDRQIIIYSLINPEDGSGTTASTWGTLTDPKHVSRLWLRPCLQEIYDVQWSPDSIYIVAGSIDSKGEIMRVLTRDTISLRGHSSYVQGVAWDPLNQMVVTQSADRSCRIHPLKHKYKGTYMAKVIKGNQQIRMTNAFGAATAAAAESTLPTFTTATEDVSTIKTPATANHLYADSTVPCFFRRPSFTPDGSLLITPAGIHRPVSSATLGNDTSMLGSSFCTHVFLRDHLQTPIVSLVGLEDPSVAVRCSPILYKLVEHGGEEAKQNSLFSGDYRMIFAVVTTSSVVLYDTQHTHPIAKIGGCHLATINDAAWSKDGRTLVCSSSDGYLTFVRFNEGALGCPLPLESVPLEVKQTYPYIYDYEYVPPISKQQKLQQQKQKESSGSASDVVIQECETTAPSPTGAGNETTSVIGSQDLPVAESTAVSKKKKRRIAPTTISPLEAAVSSGSVFPTDKAISTSTTLTAISSPSINTSGGKSPSPAGQGVPSTSLNGVAPSPQTGTTHESAPGPASVPLPVPLKKTKKRIAPTLLTTL